MGAQLAARRAAPRLSLGRTGSHGPRLSLDAGRATFVSEEHAPSLSDAAGAKRAADRRRRAPTRAGLPFHFFLSPPASAGFRRRRSYGRYFYFSA